MVHAIPSVQVIILQESFWVVDFLILMTVTYLIWTENYQLAIKATGYENSNEEHVDKEMCLE